MTVHTSSTAGRRPSRVALAATGVLVAALTAGCGSSDDDATAGTDTSPSSSSGPSSTSPEPSEGSSPAPAEEVVITISDFSYEAPDSVPAGATVTVVNEDDVAHTVTASGDGGFDVNVAGGATGTFTAPDEAGDYEFTCTFHGNMTGTLVVA